MAASAPPLPARPARLGPRRSAGSQELERFAGVLVFAVRYLATARRAGTPFPTAWGWLLARVDDEDDRSVLAWSTAAWQAGYDRAPAGRVDGAVRALVAVPDVD